MSLAQDTHTDNSRCILQKSVSGALSSLDQHRRADRRQSASVSRCLESIRWRTGIAAGVDPGSRLCADCIAGPKDDKWAHGLDSALFMYTVYLSSLKVPPRRLNGVNLTVRVWPPTELHQAKHSFI